MVDSGPASIVGTNASPNNFLYVSVNVCQPGTTTCVTIDHVQVSTQTTGLRILASAIAGVALTPEQDPAAAGNTLAECYQLSQGTAFGSLVTADVQIGGETASNVPIQLMSSPAAQPSTSVCTHRGFISTVQQLGANGVLGLAPFAQDCTNQGCTSQYFTCHTNLDMSVNCSQSVSQAPPSSAQVTNPVTMFATDNNGVIITLPAVDPAAGSATGAAAGTLTFGIGTQSNNAYNGGATAFAADPATGAVTTSYTSQTAGSSAVNYSSWFDTAGVAYYFTDAGIKPCAQSDLKAFYCPDQALPLQASVTGAGNVGTGTVSFTIANAATLGATGNVAFSSLGANPPDNYPANSFIWGLPFFFGHTVFIAYPNASITGSGGTPLKGPFYAF